MQKITVLSVEKPVDKLLHFGGERVKISVENEKLWMIRNLTHAFTRKVYPEDAAGGGMCDYRFDYY